MGDSTVLEYNCPCCGAGLQFSAGLQKLKCEYCDNEFEISVLDAYASSNAASDSVVFQWEASDSNDSEQIDSELHMFLCQSCGGQLMTDENTVATFCPYCENPTIVESRVGGVLKPSGVIPFKKDKQAAISAFLALCKRKPILPKEFIANHRLEKISGVYVPFWLYDCDGKMSCNFNATRLHHWSDAHYNYTRTDHYLLSREAVGSFAAIPMDASSKMDNAIMESIEPYDYTQLVDFETAYLSGFLADKYDIESEAGEPRIKERASQSLMDAINHSVIGYATAVPTGKQLHIQHGTAKYVLLPVWMLHTTYKDKIYTFAMNGQTGKMTGKFPMCPKRSVLWFSGICAAVTALASLIAMFAG